MKHKLASGLSGLRRPLGQGWYSAGHEQGTVMLNDDGASRKGLAAPMDAHANKAARQSVVL